MIFNREQIQFLDRKTALPLGMLTGVFLALLFPPWDLAPLAFVALVPLLYAAARSTPAGSFWSGCLAGVIMGGTYFFQLLAIEGFPLPAFIVIALFCGTFYGVFAALYSFIIIRTGWPPVLVAPALWVAVEYLRGHFFFLSNPGYQLGYSLHGWLPVIQIASVTSVYGVSFLIVLVNAAIAEGLPVLTQRWRQKSAARSCPGMLFRTGLVLAVCLAVLAYGLVELRNGQGKPLRTVKVSLVQANLTPGERGRPELKEAIMDRYEALTRAAAQEDPDLIVWPESATPTHFVSDPVIYDDVNILVRETGVPLVLGSSARDKTVEREVKGVRVNNNAYLVDRRGEITTVYKKVRLVPFWEYLPLEGRIKWPRWLVPEHGFTIPGKEANTFKVEGHRFGVVICWEVFFPELFRRFTRKDMDFMLNLSNESVFGPNVTPYKIQPMAVFRAVESRMSLLRCALTGMTSHIDPFGREIDRVTDGNGNDLMVRGFITARVPILNRTTFYTKNGDLFAFLCIGWSFLLIIFSMVLTKRLL